MEIDLHGYKVQIDADDYDRVMALKWWLDRGQIKKRNKIYFYHSFYVSRHKTCNVALHRFILGLSHKDGYLCDHINGDTLDNRKCNLRKCTNTENSRNAKRPVTNTTGYKGVYLNKPTNKYVARITVDNKKILLGYYSDPKEAYTAYCEASKKYHGEFSRTE